jgi:ribosomal protein S18 acetylase RimI-like enzyme
MSRFNIKAKTGTVTSIHGSGENFRQFMLQLPNTDESFYRYGKEKLVYQSGEVVKLVGEYGSIRYLYRDTATNRVVGALQLVKEGRLVTMTTIFTDIHFRNQGIATKLIKKAKKEYGQRLFSSNNFTEKGAEFFKVEHRIFQVAVNN